MHKKVLLIFGGKSAEHEISIASATSIFKNIDREKYKIGTIGVTKKGLFVENIDPTLLKPVQEEITLESSKLGSNSSYFMEEHWIRLIEEADVIFPLMHGPGGEDGNIQGLLESLNKKYVGSKVASSAICMDKTLTKIILEKANLSNVPYIILNKNKIDDKTNEKILALGLPIFVKPANLGSSIGITKVKEEKDLEAALSLAFKYDEKVLVEKAVKGRELEISVLGNNNLRTSLPGEIIPNAEYYDYEAKYITGNAELIVPAQLDEKIVEQIKIVAIKAYQELGCKGLARVDFFLEEKTNKLYINEVNTIPGFTKISMYPRLFLHEGMTYQELISELIYLAEIDEDEKNV